MSPAGRTCETDGILVVFFGKHNLQLCVIVLKSNTAKKWQVKKYKIATPGGYFKVKGVHRTNNHPRYHAVTVVSRLAEPRGVLFHFGCMGAGSAILGRAGLLWKHLATFPITLPPSGRCLLSCGLNSPRLFTVSLSLGCGSAHLLPPVSPILAVLVSSCK